MPRAGRAGGLEASSSSSGDEGSSSSGSSASYEEEEGTSFCYYTACFLSRCGLDPGDQRQQLKERAAACSSPSREIPQKALALDNRGRTLEQDFQVDLEQPVGEGGYASVCIGTERSTGREYAVKCIAKSLVASTDKLQDEVDIMLALDHPNIVKLFQTYEDRRFVYLVMELCKGGELFERVVDLGRLSEQQTAMIMQQIFRAVLYMHQTGICHRDLKPENFLFQAKDEIEHNTVKVIDFGIAARYDPDSPFSTKTGTPFYVAPEVIGRWPQYGIECDCWSCGVVMYVLLSGRMPFWGASEAATLSKVAAGKFGFPSESFGRVSKDAKELIRRLLTLDKGRRMTASQALNHPWVKSLAPYAESAPLQAGVVDNIKKFQSENRMKKAALKLVARQLNSGQLEKLRSTFTVLDRDGSGTIGMAELEEGLRAANLRPEQFQEMMRNLDSDGSGAIDYSEFLAATMEQRLYLQESACWNAFRLFDRNDDGVISQSELADVLQNCALVRDGAGGGGVEELMAEVDLNHDGFISFEEFMAMMRR